MGIDQINSEEINNVEKIKAIVVEDSPENKFVVEREIRESGGFELIFTKDKDNVEDALKILDDQNVDLIFCDLRLPNSATDKAKDPQGGLKIATKGKDRAKYFILSTANAQAFAGMTEEQLKDLGINSIVDKYSPSLKVLRDRIGEAKEAIKDSRDWQIPKSEI